MRLGLVLGAVGLLAATAASAREKPLPIKPCYYERVALSEAAPKATLRRLGDLPRAARHVATQRPNSPPCLLLASAIMA